jgi:hypothetical protein
VSGKKDSTVLVLDLNQPSVHDRRYLQLWLELP